MESREPRFWLRFDSGPRQGEELPLSSGTNRIGRRPENQIVVSDPSVSGRHAEIRIEGDRLLLVDLGSTNGTKIGSERIEERALAHGDTFSLGNVQVHLSDRSLATPTAPEPEPSSASEVELGRVSADHVEASRRRSVLGLVSGLLVLAAGAGALWWFKRGGGEGTVTAAVSEVPGNLLVDGSFESEGDDADWSARGFAQGLFERDAGFAQSGRLGLGALVAEGESALASSPSFDLNERRGVEASASLWAEDGALARFGIELSSSRGAGPSFLAWAPALARTDGFEEVVLRFPGLPGYDRGRLLVAAHGDGEGAVSVDDVSVVVSREIPPADASFLEVEGHVLGEVASTGVLVRGGRVLFAGIELGCWNDAGFVGTGKGSWAIEETENGMAFGVQGSVAEDDLRVLVNMAIPEGEADESGWIASIGPRGYRSHSNEFSVEDATSLLLGRGIDLVRIGFEQPLAITGQIAGGALELRADLAGTRRFEVQLSFVEERTRANGLRDEARAAERKQDAAAALGAWTSLLNEVPFDGSLVAEAEEARARLLQAGFEEAEDIRREVERARFFELSELFEACYGRARRLRDTYRSTEVEEVAQGILDQVSQEHERHGGGLAERDLARLGAVRAALGSDAPELVEHITKALEGLQNPAQGN